MMPKISILVAMRNEAGYIEECLSSIFAQDYPTDRLEVWVLDSQSSDDSWKIVERILKGRPNCHLLSNSKITQSAGWNLGIKHATGDIIAIVSAHAELASDYISTAVETMQRTCADMVGGPMRADGKGRVGKAVALATSTPFGVGGGRFHYTDREEDVDTVYMGLWWRDLNRRIGGFDEEMVRNQDDEFSYRLLKQGGRIVCNPSIRSRYENRSTLRSLWRQYFQYGLWKIRVMQKHPRQMRLSHFIPLAFVTALLCSTGFIFFSDLGQLLLALVSCSYVLANLSFSVWISYKHGWKYLPLLPIVFAILHLSYGLGFLAGIVKFAGKWGTKSTNPVSH